MLSQKEKNILKTICYFDLFNYPLTFFEVWKWYMDNGKKERIELDQVKEILDNKENSLANYLERTESFYHLKGRGEIVARRSDNYLLAEPRWKKVRKVTNILQGVPFLRMVAVCNTLPINDIKPGSDIDTFIVAKKGRMFLTRLIVTSLVYILGEWRHGQRIENKLCLSFFVTDDAMDLSKIAKKPKDIYLNYWVSMVSPIYDESVYDNFVKQNKWIRDMIPNFVPIKMVPYEREYESKKHLKTIKRWSENVLRGNFGQKVEEFCRKIQLKKIEKNYKSGKRKRKSDVIYNEKMLKFHEIDRRELYRERLEERYREVLDIDK